MTREQIETRIAELKAKNEAATSWGAAVGARSEEIKELEGQLRAMTVQRSSAGSTEAWLDLHSHREAWRTAIEVARNISSADRDDMDEKGYWEHELRAFDRVFAALPAAPPVGLAQAVSTPSARWRANGEADPHGNQYDCERAKLAHGDMTDDEIANALFLKNYDIGIITAAKERIRWLSRALEKAAGVEPSSAGTTEVRCYGCGSPWNNLDLAVAKRNDPKIISCCPERKPLDIDAWMERAVAAEQKLRTINEPQTVPKPAKIRHRGVFIERQLQAGGAYRFICHTGINKFLPDLYDTQKQAIQAIDTKLRASALPRPQHSTTKGES